MGSDVPVPQFVTHYYLPDRRPLLNLSDLDDTEAFQVMSERALEDESSRPAE
jgi:hypothetical protein